MPNSQENSLCGADALCVDASAATAVSLGAYETYHIMADAMPQIVWSAHVDGRREYFNQRWYEHTGYSYDQSRGWGWVSALHEEDGARCMDAWAGAAKLNDTFECEYRLFCAEDNSFRWHMERALPVFDPDGSVVKWFGTCTDVNELKTAQEEISQLNARLQRSMTETHHRVKNNLQIISAMVDMQLMNGEEMISADEFRRLGSHVRTLAAVHNILTSESKSGIVGTAISLKEILDQLIPVHQQTAPNCTIVADVQDVALPGRQGTSLALVVNELISNAIKHGQGLVEVVVAREPNRILVTVCDDGPGFPDGFDPRVAANTGLELVDNLTHLDLRGAVTYSNQAKGGAQVTLSIPS